MSVYVPIVCDITFKDEKFQYRTGKKIPIQKPEVEINVELWKTLRLLGAFERTPNEQKKKQT